MKEEFSPKWWQGRIDEEVGEKSWRWHQVIKAYSEEAEENSFVFLGFACDEGVRRNQGRVGAAAAPQKIRQFLSGIPYHQPLNLLDAGDILCENGDLEKARELQTEIVSQMILQNQKPIVLGGGHEVALGNFAALFQHEKNIGVINIDAHFDLRKPSPQTNSGTGFYEMNALADKNNSKFKYFCLGIQSYGNTPILFQKADEIEANYIFAEEIHQNLNWEETLQEFIEKVDVLYLTLDMDVFDVAYAPGVSATCVNGLTPFQVQKILKLVSKSGKLALTDVAELNPNFDIDDCTAKLAAYMIAYIIENWK
ncbi:Formimidoylglutamase [Candidatus Ornithobacterium hominis]|uniref:formimidoylglutamase n=1 Tax=Candidatus Ornithobacterium hominis TaxID=2497989 RepID=UPI000E5ACEA9|nr:formimidoylglutamase [Candidatus Ornithobacterium hominis]SZD73493.1 Formimidoylglutamase [Candidatus Ornithobacterium hominis]